MSKILSAINTHGLVGEYIDEDIRLEVDGQYSGVFKPTGAVYEFWPISHGGIDITKLGRIRAALAKANKIRYREQA